MIIKHRPGKGNVAADAQSKIPVNENGGAIKYNILTSVILDSRETVISETKRDSEFGRIYRFLQDPENFEEMETTAIRNRAENYEIIDDLLFYKKNTKDNIQSRLVIPTSLRIEIIKELHDFLK